VTPVRVNRGFLGVGVGGYPTVLCRLGVLWVGGCGRLGGPGWRPVGAGGLDAVVGCCSSAQVVGVAQGSPVGVNPGWGNEFGARRKRRRDQEQS